MFSYVIRRLLYAIPIVAGVMIITFFLFFTLQTVDQVARQQLGPKASPQAVQNWLHQRDWDKPTWLNLEKGAKPFDSLFFNQMKALATFDLGKSLSTNEPVLKMFKRGALPSLLITLPAFLTGIFMAVAIGLFLVYVRDTPLDTSGTIIAVILMSVPVMVDVIFGQWFLAVVLKYFPAFGYNMDSLSGARFLFLPICILVIGGLGTDVRLYRAIFLEESRNDYVRTALAKGLSARGVFVGHILKNGMINIITLTVSALPLLILGSLILEQFFGIPGLGNLALTAIHSGDFVVIQATTFVGSLLYLLGLLLTDFCYALVDPRVKLK
ncbi:ABC transporter permease [soil metagenome]